MKALVGVIAALVILGIAALSMLTARQLSSSPDHVAGPAYSDHGTNATAAAFMTPWPDLNDLTTSVSTARVSVASASAEQESSSPVVSERAAQTRVAATHHRSSLNAYAQHHSRKKEIFINTDELRLLQCNNLPEPIICEGASDYITQAPPFCAGRFLIAVRRGAHFCFISAAPTATSLTRITGY